ncbi:MAG: alpha/beta hydrolase [Oscillospiraceae bacterium]|jgi:acetyl esterase/lipase|nr:alpha/beta hydrolase [Oscillospiraceae bacterium]
MRELYEKTLRELHKNPEYTQKLDAYLSIDRLRTLFISMMDVPLKTLRRLPVRFVGETLDSLIDFLISDDVPIKADDSRSIPLWKRPPCFVQNSKQPYIIPFLLPVRAPVVVIAPGGGYSNVSLEHEGIKMARAFNAKGFHAVVLNYRVSPARYPAPQLDLIRAIQITRSKADEWNIIPDQLALAGFSAGGHLCASTAALHKELAWQSGNLQHVDTSPNVLILGYPQVDLCFRYMGLLSGIFLLNAAPVGDYRRLSSHNLVKEGYPPTFLWSEKDDPFVKVKENSDLLKKALEREKIPHIYRLYEGDMHGSGLAEGRPAEVWFDEAVSFLRDSFGFAVDEGADAKQPALQY